MFAGAGIRNFAEAINSRVGRGTPDGVITTYAGNGLALFNGDNLPATRASFSPGAIALDPTGNLYIADQSSFRIRRVSPQGIITTFPGNGSMIASGDGGPATSAGFNSITGLAADRSGNVYIGEGSLGTIRKVSPNGIISAFAAVRLLGMATDAQGLVIIAGENRIRRIEQNGAIVTLAGTGVAGYSGDGGPATAGMLQLFRVSFGVNGSGVLGLAADSAGNIFFSDSGNYRLRRVSGSGILDTVAGNGLFQATGDRGPAVSAQLAYPSAGDLGSQIRGSASAGNILAPVSKCSPRDRDEPLC